MSTKSEVRAACVLGATGFVGRRLVKALRGCGLRVAEHSSTTLDLLASDAAARLAAAFDDRTVVYTPMRARGTDALACCERDVAMAATLARALALSPPAAVVVFSTLSVYGDADTNVNITEHTPVAPTSPYGIGKLAAELLVRDAAASAGVRCVVLRPCKIYGPGDTAHTYGPVRFIEDVLESGRAEVYGDGRELRDFIFADDVVQAAIGLSLGAHDGSFNVATGTSHSFLEILELLRRCGMGPFEVRHVPRRREAIDQRVDPGRLLQALPGFSFTTLADGLAATCAHYRACLTKGTLIDG